MKKLIELIQSLVAAKFHGSLTIKFFNGEIRHIEEVRSHDIAQFK